MAYKGTLKSKYRPGEEIDFPPSRPRKWLHDASFDCMLSECLTEIISAIPRVTLSFSPGQLRLRSDFVHVKVPPGRILGGKSSSVRSRYWTAHSSPFSFHPTLPNRQTRLFISSVIMNEPGRRTPQLCALYLWWSPYYLLVHIVLGWSPVLAGIFLSGRVETFPNVLLQCVPIFSKMGRANQFLSFLYLQGFYFLFFPPLQSLHRKLLKLF